MLKDTYALDTNVLIRLLVKEKDNEEQTRRAAAFLKRHCTADYPGFINLIVLSETVWVLRRAYRYDRKQIAEAVRWVIQAEELEVDHPLIVWAALHRYEKGSADFADYLIGQYNREIGCTSTATFDSDAGKDDAFTLI